MSLQRIISGSFVVGNTTTNPIQLNELSLVGFMVSGSTITGTTVSFLVSVDGISYYPLYDNTSAEVTLTVTSGSRAYNLDPSVFFGWNYVQARLGNSGSAVAQTGQNTPIQFNAKMI